MSLLGRLFPAVQRFRFQSCHRPGLLQQQHHSRYFTVPAYSAEQSGQLGIRTKSPGQNPLGQNPLGVGQNPTSVVSEKQKKNKIP